MIITLKNFMSHDATTFELPDTGLVQVTGPNGAGKSAIIEAFSMAIWGRGTRSSKWHPWRPDQAGAATIEDGTIKVTRSRTASGTKKLSWDLIAMPETYDYDTTSKGQEALEAIVGSFDAWRRTSVFSSADAAHFTLATDAERKELLEELLGLGWFDRALALCRKDLHAARSALGQAERDRDIEVARAEEAAKLLRQAHSVLAETPDPGDVGLLRVELTKVDRFARDVAKEIDSLNDRRAKLAGTGGEELAQSRELKAKLGRLSGDECFTCGQAIPQSLRDALSTEANEALSRSAKLRGEVVDELKSITSQVEELQEERDALSARHRELSGKITSITQARAIRTRLEGDAEKARTAIHELGQRLEKHKAAIEKARVDVAELEACEKVLGVRGARALLVGRTLSGIESLANAWMAKLGSSIEVGLRPYTEKKSGGTVDSISLLLTGAGGEGGYLGASAGERRRVDVAILLALAELADGASEGRRWRSPIFFDEVFDGLDDDGKEAVMDLMTGIASTRLVVLITHNEQLAADRADLRLRVDAGTVT